MPGGTARTGEQPTDIAAGASSNTAATASGTAATAAATGGTSKATRTAARPPPQRGNGRQQSKSRRTAKAAAAAANSRSSSSGSPPAVEEVVAPPVPPGAASVERTFQSLAVAFGETLVPLDRGATHRDREVVWTARMRHFHARIQAQQVLLQSAWIDTSRRVMVVFRDSDCHYRSQLVGKRQHRHIVLFSIGILAY